MQYRYTLNAQTMIAQEAVEAVHTTVGQGDALGVARMLDEDPRLLSSTRKGQQLLTLAAGKGHADIVTLLLQRGAEVNTLDGNGNTALHLATHHGHLEVVRILISYGADLYMRELRNGNQRGLLGFTPLLYASRFGHGEVVRLLLHYMGGRGLDEMLASGRTSLWYACSDGYVDIVRALLLAGADHTLAASDPLGSITPLESAEFNGHHQCVALIQVSTSFS